MRCSKSCYLHDLELVDLFDNGVIEQVYCFVEQKNDSVVRLIIGYYRFEGEAAHTVMADLYEQYNKLVNFFFLSMKIIRAEDSIPQHSASGY